MAARAGAGRAVVHEHRIHPKLGELAQVGLALNAQAPDTHPGSGQVGPGDQRPLAHQCQPSRGASRGDYPEPAARAGRAVAEERARRPRGDGGHVDVLAGHPGLPQHQPVGGPQVEEPPAGAVRLDGQGGVLAERLPRRRRDLLAHLVPVRADRGPDTGDDAARPGAERRHGGQRGVGHPGNGAAPSRVHAGDHVCAGVVEDDRHTVGDNRPQDGTRVAGDQGIGFADSAGGGGRAAAPVRGGHDPRDSAMHLGAEDEVCEVGAQRRGGPAAVLQHVPLVVPHAETEVQCGVGPGGDAAVAGGDQHVDRQPVKGRPGQDPQVSPLAHLVPGRGLSCHRLGA